jgi:hypothetical protein
VPEKRSGSSKRVDEQAKTGKKPFDSFCDDFSIISSSCFVAKLNIFWILQKGCRSRAEKCNPISGKSQHTAAASGHLNRNKKINAFKKMLCILINKAKKPGFCGILKILDPILRLLTLRLQRPVCCRTLSFTQLM